jgi:hypothetical protein
MMFVQSLRVVSVTAVLSGSRIRLITARDARISAAKVDLLKSRFAGSDQ